MELKAFFGRRNIKTVGVNDSLIVFTVNDTNCGTLICQQVQLCGHAKE